jgi:hypothetical protein
MRDIPLTGWLSSLRVKEVRINILEEMCKAEAWIVHSAGRSTDSPQESLRKGNCAERRCTCPLPKGDEKRRNKFSAEVSRVGNAPNGEGRV